MRLFVAIELSEGFRKRLVEMQDALRAAAPGVSFTKAENLHLTLKFIGEVEDQRVPALCGALKEIPKVGNFEVRLAGMDLLPERGPIRIISASVEGGEELLTLQSAIEEACAAQKVPREGRRYRPHITLARARQGFARSRGGQFLQAVTDQNASANVAEIVLMQSRLSDQGSQYTALYHQYLQ